MRKNEQGGVSGEKNGDSKTNIFRSQDIYSSDKGITEQVSKEAVLQEGQTSSNTFASDKLLESQNSQMLDSKMTQCTTAFVDNFREDHQLPFNDPPLPCDASPLPCNAPPLPCNAPPLPCNAPPLPCNAPPLPCNASPLPCNAPSLPCYAPPLPCINAPPPTPPRVFQNEKCQHSRTPADKGFDNVAFRCAHENNTSPKITLHTASEKQTQSETSQHEEVYCRYSGVIKRPTFLSSLKLQENQEEPIYEEIPEYLDILAPGTLPCSGIASDKYPEKKQRTPNKCLSRKLCVGLGVCCFFVVLLAILLNVLLSGTNDGNDNTAQRVKPFVHWPSGLYGLPRTTTGCPKGFQWDTGWIRQSMTSVVPRYNFSPGIRLQLNFSQSFIYRYFCMKTSKKGDGKRHDWPRGQYCIFRKGQSCPRGLSSGYIKWDDKDSGNANGNGGALPDGKYDMDTTMYYCCQTEGSNSIPITMATTDPFVLMPYNSRNCQRVKFAIATLEWISFYGEQNVPKGEHGGKYPYTQGSPATTTRFYCYYESCNYTLTTSWGFFKSPKFPNAYPEGQHCAWRISQPKGFVVSSEISFIGSPSIDSSSDCLTVEAFDGLSERAPSLGVFRYNTRSSPMHVVSSSSEMLIILRSNASTANQAITAYYTAVHPGNTDNGLDNCSSNPCANGGKCRFHMRGYSCVCDVEYTGKKCETEQAVPWPTGAYTIPRTSDGCPSDGGFTWMRGFIRQRTAATNTSKAHSRMFHMHSSVTSTYIGRSFCTKLKQDNDNQRPIWPKGTYCIYQFDPECPLGLSPGWIQWAAGRADFVVLHGFLPKSSSPNGHDRRMFLICCSTFTNATDQPVSLPVHQPLILFRYGSFKCQKVKSAIVHEEWIRFSTAKKASVGGAHPHVTLAQDAIVLHFCYNYSCQYKIRGRVGTLTADIEPYTKSQTKCSWHLTGPLKSAIRLQFTTFNLDAANVCRSCYAQVFDGPNSTARVLGTLSGSHKPPVSGILSTTNEVFVTLHWVPSSLHMRLLAQCTTSDNLTRTPHAIAHWLLDGTDPDVTFFGKPRFGAGRYSGTKAIVVSYNNYALVPRVSFRQRNFTIACWVRFAVIGYNVIIADSDTFNTASILFYASQYSRITIDIRPFASREFSLSSNTLVSSNTWYHVSVTCNSQSGHVMLYIDGAESGASTYTSSSVGYATTGDRYAVGLFNSEGSLMDLYITDVVMSARQINELRRVY